MLGISVRKISTLHNCNEIFPSYARDMKGIVFVFTIYDHIYMIYDTLEMKLFFFNLNINVHEIELFLWYIQVHTVR